MKFKCPCGSVHYQIFVTSQVEEETYVTDDTTDFPENPVWDQTDCVIIGYRVQCEFCNTIYGPKPSMKRLISYLKKQGVLK